MTKKNTLGIELLNSKSEEKLENLVTVSNQFTPLTNLIHPSKEDLELLKTWDPINPMSKTHFLDLVPSEFRNITPPHLGGIDKPLTPEQKRENQEALKTLREALTSKETKPTLK